MERVRSTSLPPKSSIDVSPNSNASPTINIITNQEAKRDFEEEEKIKIKLKIRRVVSISVEEKEDERGLYFVLKKSTILTIVSLFTTNLAVIMNEFVGIGASWVAIDSTVNMICIILMFNMHTNKYEKICHGLDLIVSDECLLCCSCHCKMITTSTQTNNSQMNAL